MWSFLQPANTPGLRIGERNASEKNGFKAQSTADVRRPSVSYLVLILCPAVLPLVRLAETLFPLSKSAPKVADDQASAVPASVGAAPTEEFVDPNEPSQVRFFEGRTIALMDFPKEQLEHLYKAVWDAGGQTYASLRRFASPSHVPIVVIHLFRQR